MSDTYSTPGEVALLIDQAYQAAVRLPCAWQDELNRFKSTRDAFLAAVQSTNTVDPTLAAGTDMYRRVHGLEPLAAN